MHPVFYSLHVHPTFLGDAWMHAWVLLMRFGLVCNVSMTRPRPPSSSPLFFSLPTLLPLVAPRSLRQLGALVVVPVARLLWGRDTRLFRDNNAVDS